MPGRAWIAAAALAILTISACSARATPDGAAGLVTKAPSQTPTSAASTPATRAALTALIPGTVRVTSVTTPETPERSAAAAPAHTITEIIPPVTDPDELPVIYLLHGLPGKSTDLCSSAMAAALMARFRAGQRPFLLACPDGNPSANDDSEWADSADGRDKLETFVTSSAIAAVEGSHPRSRTERAIGGFSMGGFGAAAIALRHPQLYSQVVTLAGYFHLDDPSAVFGVTPTEQAAHDPTALVTRAPAMRWYLAEAIDDNEELSAHDSERFSALLAGVGATHQLSITAGEHDVTWATSAFVGSVAFLNVGWPA